MTKSVRVTNTSNWHGENVKIEVSNAMKDGKLVDDNFVMLKPGESCDVSPIGYASVKIIDACERTIAPFYLDGKQVLPSCKTEWKVSDGAERGSVVPGESVDDIKPNMDSARNIP